MIERRPPSPARTDWASVWIVTGVVLCLFGLGYAYADNYAAPLILGGIAFAGLGVAVDFHSDEP